MFYLNSRTERWREFLLATARISYAQYFFWFTHAFDSGYVGVRRLFGAAHLGGNRIRWHAGIAGEEPSFTQSIEPLG